MHSQFEFVLKRGPVIWWVPCAVWCAVWCVLCWVRVSVCWCVLVRCVLSGVWRGQVEEHGRGGGSKRGVRGVANFSQAKSGVQSVCGKQVWCIAQAQGDSCQVMFSSLSTALHSLVTLAVVWRSSLLTPATLGYSSCKAVPDSSLDGRFRWRNACTSGQKEATPDDAVGTA